MTDKMRDKVVGAMVSVAASVAVFVIGFWLTGMRLSDEKFEQRLDRKVDKELFDEECKRVDNRIFTLETSMKESNNDTKKLLEVMNMIREQNGRIETDINWLKKNSK
jgi:3-phenylpropionate/cinnamic acid dioxygenase small subunit